MKNSIKLAAAALCMAMGMVYSQAQSTNTNGVATISFFPQNLNISLTGLSSGGGTNSTAPGSTFRVTTKDVINAVVGPTKSAKLLYGQGTLTDTNGTTFTAPVFVVSSGSSKNTTNTIVSDFFSVVTNTVVLGKGGSSSEILTLGLGMDSNGVFTNADGTQLTPLTFLVQGFTSVQKSGAFTSKANGPGTASSGGSTLVLNGTITASAPGKKAITFNP